MIAGMRMMAGVGALALLVMPVAVRAQAVAPADSAAVVKTLETMFEALRNKNADGVRATFHESARFTLLRPAADGSTRVNVMSAEQFITAVTNPNGNGVDEPIRNVRVMIDGPLASAWAEYQVRVAGKVSHCGYDAFHLVKVDTAWKILNVSDSFRPQGCGEVWK